MLNLIYKVIKILQYLGQGFVAIFLVFLFASVISETVYACGTLPEVHITSNVSYCSGTCSATISWGVDCNPDNEVPSISGPGLSSSANSGSQSVNFTSPATYSITLTGVTATAQIINATPTPAPATATPAPTAYPNYRVCNAACGNNNECAPGLNCINGLCRLPSNPNDSSCNAPSYGSSSSPTSPPTPTKTSTSGTSSVLGIKTTVTPTPTTGSESTNSPEVLGSQSDSTMITETPTPTPSGSITKTISDHPIISGVIGAVILGAGVLFYKIRKDLNLF